MGTSSKRAIFTLYNLHTKMSHQRGSRYMGVLSACSDDGCKDR